MLIPYILLDNTLKYVEEIPMYNLIFYFLYHYFGKLLVSEMQMSVYLSLFTGTIACYHVHTYEENILSV